MLAHLKLFWLFPPKERETTIYKLQCSGVQCKDLCRTAVQNLRYMRRFPFPLCKFFAASVQARSRNKFLGEPVPRRRPGQEPASSPSCPELPFFFFLSSFFFGRGGGFPFKVSPAKKGRPFFSHDRSASEFLSPHSPCSTEVVFGLDDSQCLLGGGRAGMVLWQQLGGARVGLHPKSCPSAPKFLQVRGKLA